MRCSYFSCHYRLAFDIYAHTFDMCINKVYLLTYLLSYSNSYCHPPMCYGNMFSLCVSVCLSAPRIYIFYGWMRHWPIKQEQTMSHSRSDNSCKYHVYFLNRRATSEYLAHIVYLQANTVFPLTDAPGLY